MNPLANEATVPFALEAGAETGWKEKAGGLVAPL